MKTLEELREFFGKDHFATRQGIVIDSAGQGEAVCRVKLHDGHRNSVGGVQGGLIFTLADYCFAVAVNSDEANTVTLDAHIHYLRGARGETLTARAVPQHRGGRICLYDVTVSDDLGTLVAKGAFTGFTKRST